MLYAMCRILKARYPNAGITVATSNPDLWIGYSYYQHEDIRFVPWAWDYDNVSAAKVYWKILNKIKKYTFTTMRETFLNGLSIARYFTNPDFYDALVKADVVISVGGHHFTTLLSKDLVSGINFDAMSILSQKPMICFSQSFGPFEFYNERNRKLTQKLLSKCILMPRENNSQECLKKFIGDGANVIPTFESVLSLSEFIEYKSIDKRDNAIGIAIYCTQYRTSEEKSTYQKTLAKFCDYVISKGYNVRFFPMEIKGTGPDDRPFINEIISKTLAPEKCSVYFEDLETQDHLNEVSKCKVFLGHKTHSTIFALATGTPLMAMAYHPKTLEFLTQFGMTENVIVDTKLSIEWLTETFDRISSSLESISKNEYAKSVDFTNRIKEDIFKAINIVTK